MGAMANLIVLSMAMWATVSAQHYCLAPFCDSKQAVVGKYTSAASEPGKCYSWFFKYLNNVAPGSRNQGSGYWNTTSIQGEPIVETYDTSRTDLLAMESNECGLTMGMAINGTRPMSSHEKALVAQGQRLPTGQLHQCPCAEEGRAHIINATSKRTAAHSFPAQLATVIPPISPAELQFVQSGGLNQIFGIHSVFCAFHSSGPCMLKDVEQGVARSWRGNFSMGYVPLMDTNIMLWTPTLGPLLDLFLRDGVEFYPMRWTAPTENSTREIFSVIASPCGKVLYEIAAPDAGGRPVEHFHSMTMARAVFRQWNEPENQPLVPLRISRAVTPELMDKTLAFYGVPDAKSAVHLGFHTEVLLDEKGEDGTRAITLRLSKSATVHLQIWAAPAAQEPEPWVPDPSRGFSQDFIESRSNNQVTGKTLKRAREFCANGTWSVSRYTWYVLQTHEATLAPIPANTSTMTPPAGNDMNVFMDDHISWDCTADECEIAAGSRSLYDAGSHITFSTFQKLWWPYSHDPAGYGFELHWDNVVPGFQPRGEVPPICFAARPDGTCPGSQEGFTQILL